MRSYFLKCFIISILIFTSSGCSRTRLVYNYLDVLLLWKLDNYITLNSDQEDRVKHSLQHFLEWHRREQLPRYLQFIEQIQKNIHTEMTADQFQQHFSEIEGFLRDIMVEAEPDIIQLLFLLDQEKQEELISNMSAKQKLREKKYLKLNPEEYREKRLKRTEKILKRFIGRLTNEQKISLINWADKRVPIRKLWLENQREWQERFHALLREKELKTSIKKELKQLLINPEPFRTVNYKKALKQNQLTTFSMLENIHNQLTEKQKKHLKKELIKIKKDLVRLSN